MNACVPPRETRLELERFVLSVNLFFVEINSLR
jgi:hypothetical protein